MFEFVVDTIDVVPEASRKFYTEKEGKFYLDADLAVGIGGLKSALDAEKQSARTNAAAVKALKEHEARFAGIDPDKVHALQAKYENDAEGKLLAEGKFDEAFAQRNVKRDAEIDRQNKEWEAKVAAAESRAESFKGKVLEDQIRAAAVDAGLHKLGIRDSMYLAKGEFSLDNDGVAVMKDANGNTVIGKDGKSPFTLKEWYEGHKTESPHWSHVSASGSPATGTSGAAGVRQIKRASFDALTPSEKSAAVKNGIKVID